MRLIACLSFLFLSGPVFAQESNRLTAEEVSAGWLLLFDGETKFGWESDGGADVEKGVLRVGGKQDTTLATTAVFGGHELKLEYQYSGKGKEARVDGAALKPAGSGKWHAFSHTQKDPSTAAPIRIQVPAGSTLLLRNVALRPLGLESIFNGKDLSGWHIFPGKKSKVVVTKEGTLNIKDGPGDVQTTGKYGDFVLQLECFSHGENLNSGVFFRCRPDEYQQGYEAQIRNQFTEEPQQVYSLQKYDPKTHELIGEVKLKYTAVDYGTGAIYRRQPARKQASKDGEWFTLTLVAHDNHFATWVNGIQVVDWTDNRAPSDNARQGYRKEAGHISFQGHDPTTNLSFRNIRIAELP